MEGVVPSVPLLPAVTSPVLMSPGRRQRSTRPKSAASKFVVGTNVSDYIQSLHLQCITLIQLAV
jgi:hypothetical protein